jgi:uncharacterized protein (DUF1697 family)
MNPTRSGGRAARSGGASQYVALLRGINVGRAKRIAMEDLRALVEELGCANVRTLLNSGNVVFTASADAAREIATRIEGAMAGRLGVTARVTVLSARELNVVASGNPLAGGGRDASRLLAGFLRTPADRRRLEPLAREDWTPDALALGARVAYIWCAEGLLESRLFEAVGRSLRDGVTTRNWATVKKLQALLVPP